MSVTVQDHAGEYAIRGGPAATVTGLTLGGYGLSDIVLVLTAIYTILQIGAFCIDRYRKYKANGSQPK